MNCTAKRTSRALLYCALHAQPIERRPDLGAWSQLKMYLRCANAEVG